MAELKTKPNNKSVRSFLDAIEHEGRKSDSLVLLSMMKEVTGKQPKMWGENIVGFGEYHYKYASGREGDWMTTGFSPRKQNLTVYIMPGFSRYGAIMAPLGKYKTGASCLYINKLADVDLTRLRELIAQAYQHMQEIYRCK